MGCVLTPKNITNDSKIQRIACCALYCKPESNRKTLLLDHISDAYNVLSTKYGRGLHFVLAGDTNDLKLDSILSLSPSLVQIVRDFTRLDPLAILDPIINTVLTYSAYGSALECVPQEVSVISTLNAGVGYLLWFH